MAGRVPVKYQYRAVAAFGFEGRVLQAFPPVLEGHHQKSHTTAAVASRLPTPDVSSPAVVMHFRLLPSLAVLASLLQTASCGSSSNKTQLPVVLWHGMGDSCCAESSIGAVQKYVERLLPGVFVHSISTGASSADDTYGGFFGSVNNQVEDACTRLAGLEQLQGGYNAVGFSQGGQFLRAVLQRCQHRGPRMARLITLGAQHQGIMNVPECWNPSYNMTPAAPFCWSMQRLLGWGAYLPWVRSHVVQAQYFKDPYNIPAYLASNLFLADLNNERGIKDPQYAVNLASLEDLVLFRFEDDITVVPRDSAWFGYFDGKQLWQMEDTQLYQEDWVGLRQLDEAGKVRRGTSPGGHMQFSLAWFGENVVMPYLAANATGLHHRPTLWQQWEKTDKPAADQ